MVRVKFFASLRERYGSSELELAAAPGMRVIDVWHAAAGQPLPEQVLMARNQEYVHGEAEVADGDEIAFFPPVTGGSGADEVCVTLHQAPFDPWQTLAAFERERTGAGSAFGATAVFVGTMRDYNEGDAVRSMYLEHYPGMTEQHLRDIRAAAMQRWPLLEAIIAHRVGHVAPGESIVLVAAWSAHRAAAFDACRFMMEDLKTRAPFWKKETLAEGERWVQGNTPGFSN